MTAPAPDGLSPGGRLAWERLFGAPIAHRGLWSLHDAGGEGAPENSLPAFSAAVEAGFGVELDVRLSADGEAYVFHDDRLRRMTGADGCLSEVDGAQIAQLRLLEAEPIPTLDEALRVIGGRALLLVELKADNRDECHTLAGRVAEVVGPYEGPLALVGFPSQGHERLARERPDILRGVHFGVGDVYGEKAESARAHFLLPALEVLRFPETAARRAAGAPLVAWTIRTPEQMETALHYADNAIFEGFRPTVPPRPAP